MEDVLNEKEIIEKIKELEIDISLYRDYVKDNRNLSDLHLAISTFITDEKVR